MRKPLSKLLSGFLFLWNYIIPLCRSKSAEIRNFVTIKDTPCSALKR